VEDEKKMIVYFVTSEDRVIGERVADSRGRVNLGPEYGDEKVILALDPETVGKNRSSGIVTTIVGVPHRNITGEVRADPRGRVNLGTERADSEVFVVVVEKVPGDFWDE